MIMENRDMQLMARLMQYGEKYEISVQLWPEYKTIYVAKDGVDLYSYGAYDLKIVLSTVLDYLDRVNRKQKPTNGKTEEGGTV